MHRAARHDAILNEIGNAGSCTVAGLASRLDVSGETIRRDIKRLASQGLLRKVHGGATLPASLHEPSFAQRMGENARKARMPEIETLRYHRTDDAFHRTSAFRSWTAAALLSLTDAGVRRGTARAVSHIATEMFLDGWLANEPTLADGYLAALDLEVNGSLRWQDGGEAYDRLSGRLSTWGAPRDYADPLFVLRRLGDALRLRPSLAIAPEEAERVAACLPRLQRRVQREARELLHELRDALGLQD